MVGTFHDQNAQKSSHYQSNSFEQCKSIRKIFFLHFPNHRWMNIPPLDEYSSKLVDGVCLNVHDSRIAKYVQIHGIFRNILGILVGLYPESSRTSRHHAAYLSTSRARRSPRRTMSATESLAQASRQLLAGHANTKQFEWMCVCGGFLAFFAAFGIGK